MVKTVTNKNIDEVLFGQLKAIDFEYLVQLNGILEEYIDDNGADTLDEEMVTFDITLGSVLKSRMNELLDAEKRVKEIIAEDSDKDSKISYVKEARMYLESLEDSLDGRIVDSECLEIIERLKGTIYEFGTLETSIDVLKTLLTTDIYRDNKSVERAITSNYLACWEVVREVEQEELDKNREYINAINIEDTEEIKMLIDDYQLYTNFIHWYMSNKFGLAHLGEDLFLSEYIEDERMHLVFQNSKDLDCSEPYCLK